MTTFTILQDMVQNVAGDRAIVESITKPGAEIHEYEPTPMDIVKAIKEPIRAMLGEISEDQHWLVSSEGAFSYLARDNNMRELFLWPVNADSEGSPQQIQKVIDTIRVNKIPVAFSESTISDKSMKQVCKESGARYGGVLYVDSLTGVNGVAPTYLKLLQYNA